MEGNRLEFYVDDLEIKRSFDGEVEINKPDHIVKDNLIEFIFPSCLFNDNVNPNHTRFTTNIDNIIDDIVNNTKREQEIKKKMQRAVSIMQISDSETVISEIIEDIIGNNNFEKKSVDISYRDVSIQLIMNDRIVWNNSARLRVGNVVCRIID